MKIPIFWQNSLECLFFAWNIEDFSHYGFFAGKGKAVPDNTVTKIESEVIHKVWPLEVSWNSANLGYYLILGTSTVNDTATFDLSSEML